MASQVHEHDGIKVYHRKDGALTFHGRRHARYMAGRDREQQATTRPTKWHIPQSGDWRTKDGEYKRVPQGKDMSIHGKKARKTG